MTEEPKKSDALGRKGKEKVKQAVGGRMQTRGGDGLGLHLGADAFAARQARAETLVVGAAEDRPRTSADAL